MSSNFSQCAICERPIRGSRRRGRVPDLYCGEHYEQYKDIIQLPIRDKPEWLAFLERSESARRSRNGRIAESGITMESLEELANKGVLL